MRQGDRWQEPGGGDVWRVAQLVSSAMADLPDVWELRRDVPATHPSWERVLNMTELLLLGQGWTMLPFDVGSISARAAVAARSCTCADDLSPNCVVCRAKQDGWQDVPALLSALKPMVKCPHGCGNYHRDLWDHSWHGDEDETVTVECGGCAKPFKLTRVVTITYRAEVV